jgi:aerobic-type carbon monoxide dehydrogenase small subunit (CoxS/CutS family)
LQGNVCRCGTHPRIIDAVRHAARMMQEHGR